MLNWSDEQNQQKDERGVDLERNVSEFFLKNVKK